MQRLLIAVPLAHALLLGGPAVRLDRPCLAAELILEDLIELVRQNELLYQNIDVTVRKKWEQDRSIAARVGPIITPNGTLQGKPLCRSNATRRYVAQGELYRHEETSQTWGVHDEAPETFVEMGAYDGDISRGRMDLIGNIITGKYEFGGPIRAHGFFGLFGGNHVPLSVWLGGERALRAYPRAKFWLRPDVDHVAQYKGRAEFQGLGCHVVWLLRYWKKGKPHTSEAIAHVVYWLAEDRNLIPVRYQSYKYQWSRTVPITEGMVREWTELQPGIWFPKHVVIDALDESSLVKRGERVHSWRCEWFVDAVSLNPNHDVSFFRDIPFPEGTIVYEVEGGQIKKGYQVGAPAVVPPAPGAGVPKRRRFLPLGAGALLIVIISFGGYRLWKRDRVQKSRRDC
jgi:hypothetical protein